MQRVKTKTAVTDLPAYSETGTPGYFRNGDPVAGAQATVPGQDWFNMVQEELLNVITAAELAPSATNDTQLLQAIMGLIAAGRVTVENATETVAGILKLASLANTLAGEGDVALTPLQALAQQLADPWAVTVGGTTNALTVSLPNVPQIALADKMRLRLRASAANTGPATLAVTFGTTAIGAVPLLKGAGAALEAGDIAGAGAVLDVQYNATLGAALLLNPAHNPAAGYTQFLAANGWAKFPNGLMLQWGSVACSLTADAFSLSAIYPLAFPTASLYVGTSLYVTSPVMVTCPAPMTVRSTTGFTQYFGDRAAAAHLVTGALYWFALGY